MDPSQRYGRSSIETLTRQRRADFRAYEVGLMLATKEVFVKPTTAEGFIRYFEVEGLAF